MIQKLKKNPTGDEAKKAKSEYAGIEIPNTNIDAIEAAERREKDKLKAEPCGCGNW